MPAFLHATLHQDLSIINPYNSCNCGCDDHCVIILMSQTSSQALLDDQAVVIAPLRDDFMGGAEEAATSVNVCLYPIITFRKHCVEQSGE